MQKRVTNDIARFMGVEPIGTREFTDNVVKIIKSG